MAGKKAKKDEFMFGTEAITMRMTDKATSFKDAKGNTLFKLPMSMSGAWSDRRVARALLTLHKSMQPVAPTKKSRTVKVWGIKNGKGPVRMDVEVLET